MSTPSSCGAISAGLTAFNCGQIAPSGTRKRVVLINYDDINFASVTDTAGVVSALPLISGKIGYLFQSAQKSTVGEATFAKGTYVNQYDHAVTLRALVKSQAVKNFVNSINGARVVAIVENLDEGSSGDVKFEIYGLRSGLVLSEMPFSTEVADGVVYSIKLASDDNAKEAELPKSFYVTSASATETAFQALYTPATGG